MELLKVKDVSNSLQPYGLQPTRLLCPWGLSRQEYWSGLQFPSPGDLPHPRIEPASLKSSGTGSQVFPLAPPAKFKTLRCFCSSWMKIHHGFPGGPDGKEFTCNMEDPSLISGSGRSPGEGNATPLQHCCLENPMAGGASWATVHGVSKSRT